MLESGENRREEKKIACVKVLKSTKLYKFNKSGLISSYTIKGRGINQPTLSLNVCTNLLGRSKCHGPAQSQAKIFTPSHYGINLLLWLKTRVISGLPHIMVGVPKWLCLNRGQLVAANLKRLKSPLNLLSVLYPCILDTVKDLLWGNPGCVDLDVPSDRVTRGYQCFYASVHCTKVCIACHDKFAVIVFHVERIISFFSFWIWKPIYLAKDKIYKKKFNYPLREVLKCF